MASNLFTCYSPSGEKFELTRPNYLDATSHFGFTTVPPLVVAADEGEDDEQPEDDADEGEDDEQPEGDEADADADEQPADVDTPSVEPLTFEDKDAAKAYLRSKEIAFDGRASLADLTALANGTAA